MLALVQRPLSRGWGRFHWMVERACSLDVLESGGFHALEGVGSIPHLGPVDAGRVEGLGGHNPARMIARQQKEHVMGLIKEFKEFALKGNFFDMAIGVVIGGAFGTIVTSLIKDIIMPVVSLPGNVDFTKSLIVLKENAADPTKNITLNYGAFVTVLINFLILAFVLFIVVKMYNAARKRFEAEKPAPAPAGPTADQKLLMEIRDLLAKR